MTRMRIPLEVGSLIRGQVRSQLNKMKSDIEWKINGSSVSIDEVKNFLTSTFYIKIEDIEEEEEAKTIKRSIENWVERINQ